MPCKSCHSQNQSEFRGEMGIHFIGLKNIGKPTVWIFPLLSICLNCGFTEFVISNAEREDLVALAFDRRASGAKA